MDEKVVKLPGGFINRGGNGAAGLQVIVRADELPQVAPDVPERPKGFGKGRKTKLAAMGLSPSIIKAGNVDYADCLFQANKYRKTRMKELTRLHGSVSSGTGALLASASLSLAASRFLFQKAAVDGCPNLLKDAAKLAHAAMQQELAAWELAQREGVIHRRQTMNESATPWVYSAPALEEGKKKAGRKTNAERQRELMDVANPEGLPVVDSEPLEASDV